MVNNARRSQGARTRGFTLLEALVVLAVLAVLLGLAVPGLQGIRERQQLQAEAEDFWNSLMLARAQAQLHQQHVTVCAASAAGECHAAAAGSTGCSSSILYLLPIKLKNLLCVFIFIVIEL